jgi:hypothetical protein
MLDILDISYMYISMGKIFVVVLLKDSMSPNNFFATKFY